METRLSTWPTFRKDLENRAGVDLGDHVVLSITVGGGGTAGWLNPLGPAGRQLNAMLMPGDTSTEF